MRYIQLQNYYFQSLFKRLLIIFTAAGVPIKLLHEGEGHVVTIELKNGEIYRGLLQEAEDTMNCQLKEGLPLVLFCFLNFI